MSRRIRASRTAIRLFAERSEPGLTTDVESPISKLDAYGTYQGGPSRDDLVHIRDEEHRHMQLCEKLIQSLPDAVRGSDTLAFVGAGDIEHTAREFAARLKAAERREAALRVSDHGANEAAMTGVRRKEPAPGLRMPPPGR